MPRNRKTTEPILHADWSPVLQSFIVMFGDSPTSLGNGRRTIIDTVEELEYEARLCGLQPVRVASGHYTFTTVS